MKVLFRNDINTPSQIRGKRGVVVEQGKGYMTIHVEDNTNGDFRYTANRIEMLKYIHEVFHD